MPDNVRSVFDYVCLGLFRFVTLRQMDTAGIVAGCEVKNEWSYNSAYPTCLLVLGTNNFTFLRYVALFRLGNIRLD